VAAIVYLLTLAIFKLFSMYYPSLLSKDTLMLIIKYFLIVALIEELFKYLIVRNFIIFSKDVDEPLDVMLYLVICALGFAALENLLLIFTTVIPTTETEFLHFIFIRFIGATFLHTLASGTLGFFLAISFFGKKTRKSLFLVGLLLAVFMHGLYNFSILSLQGTNQILAQAAILFVLALFTSWGFVELTRIKNARKIVPQTPENRAS